MPEAYWHISQCDFFSQMLPEDIRRLEAGSRVRRFKRGETVYLPADAADGVLLLTSGRIKICHLTPEGKQSILVFVEPGELFGELSLLDTNTREEYAEAIESSQIVLIPRELIHWAMAKYAHVTLGVTKLIGLRRRRVERRLKNLLFRSNRERLIFLILELLEQYGENKSSGIELGIKLSHQDLANIIGSTRETVTVVLGQLQNEGLIKIARRKLTVIDVDKLAAEVKEFHAKEPDEAPVKQPSSQSDQKLRIM